MAKTKKKVLAAAPVLGAEPTFKLPVTPVNKPKLRFGYLADVNRLPVIRNFSYILQWMYDKWPVETTIKLSDYINTPGSTLSVISQGDIPKAKQFVEKVAAAWDKGGNVRVIVDSVECSVAGIARTDHGTVVSISVPQNTVAAMKDAGDTYVPAVKTLVVSYLDATATGNSEQAKSVMA